MAFNGSGVFVRLFSWATDKANNIKILASRMDSEMDGFATGLSTCVTKDGQTTITADLPMSGFKHTGVDDADARTQYAKVSQVVDGAYVWCGTATGTADAIALSPSPTITAYAAGQRFRFIASANNTTAVTVDVSSVGTKAGKKLGGLALAADDIVAGRIYEASYDGTNMEMAGILGSYYDDNDNEVFTHAATASAVNQLHLINAATGNGPTLTAEGETNVPVTIAGKGTGKVVLGQSTSTEVQLADDQPITDSNGNELVAFSATASAVNEVTFTNAATTDGPIIAATGGDTDIDLNINPKGDGNVILDGLSYPNADGDAGDVLITNGSGTVSFASLGFSTFFESTEQTCADDTKLDVAHGLGAVPKLVQLFLRCKTNDGNFTAGDEVWSDGFTHTASTDRGISVLVDSTNVSIVQAAGLVLIDPTTFNSATITESSWRWIVRAWA